MKKEILIVLIIILLICLAHIYVQKFIKFNFNEILTDLDYLEDMILNNKINKSDLNNETEKILEKLENKSKILGVYIEHDELEKLEKELVSLQANIMIENYDYSIEKIKGSEFIIKHIIDKESLRLVNIF